jgi:hypothetical protein
MNLGPIHLASPLWFGSGIHYALEDFHGYRVFDSAERAFIAYCIATAQNYVRDLPSDYADLFILGQRMMQYYQYNWLRHKRNDQTFWAPNPITQVSEPQVEVNFEIPITPNINPAIEALCRQLGIDVILYRGTIDRVVQGDYETLLIDEYKTAKVIQTQHYMTDPQVSRYVWAGAQIYEQPVVGVIYHQFWKRSADPPRILQSGKVSTAQNLVTSESLYRQRLLDLYNSVDAAPKANIDFLWALASSENENRDRYVRRDEINRTVQQIQSQGILILLELEDMLNPDLPLYPNPTRDCFRLCSFLSPCVSLDDGGDWELELEADYCERDLEVDRLWRSRLPDPRTLHERLQGVPQDRLPDIDLGLIQQRSREDQYRAEIAADDVDDINDYTPPPEWKDPSQGDEYTRERADPHIALRTAGVEEEELGNQEVGLNPTINLVDHE